MRTLAIVSSVLVLVACSVAATVALRHEEAPRADPAPSLRLDPIEQRILDMRERDAAWKQARTEAEFLRQYEALRRDAQVASAPSR